MRLALALAAALAIGTPARAVETRPRAAPTPTAPTVIEGTLPTSDAECASCHPDVAAEWEASAHHLSSFNNPYYRRSVDDFRHQRGAPASRFCAGCHDPVLLPEIAQPIDPLSRAAQAGIVCLVCHSVDAVPRLDGNGDYHASVSAVPYGGPAHQARLRPALLDEPRFCEACHKVGLTPEVTHDRWLRGQDDYDAWQASAAAGNGAGAIWRPAKTQTCQDCHMPLEPAVLGDAAAKGGMIRSHRFLGGNAALASLRGDSDTESRETSELAGAVSLALAPAPQRPDLLDVILRNRRVGHRFPGGTMDSDQVWLEVEARGKDGALLGRSGSDPESGRLDGDVHLLRAQPVDGAAHPIARRDPQHARGVVFDTSLSPADPQVVRYALPPGTTQVLARLRYRKFSPDYAARACAYLSGEARRRCRAVPIVEIARATFSPGEPARPDFSQLVDHGLALASGLADEASQARPLLEEARTLAPDRPEPLLALARLALALGQTDEAVADAQAAARLAPSHPAALYYQALALEAAYRQPEALAPAERLAALLPDDRAALALLARVRGVVGDPAGALDAAQRLTAIDPFADSGWYQRALAESDLGRPGESEDAQARYLEHRVADEIDLALRRKWCARHPDRPDEAVPLHIHALHRR
jgi:hypothetical protein